MNKIKIKNFIIQECRKQWNRMPQSSATSSTTIKRNLQKNIRHLVEGMFDMTLDLTNKAF